MTSLVVSDLHLGTRSGLDLLRHQEVREALAGALEGVDELVLLGDVVELREGRTGSALAAARPALEALGAALGSRRRVVLSAGNHDHRLVGGWLERRRHAARHEPLQPEQRLAPAEASDAAAAIAGWLAPAAVEVAYPGAWLAAGVYATHGHYLDRHVTVPSLEPFAIRAVERVLGRRGRLPDGVDGYEAVSGPVYALLHELAQAVPVGASAGAGPSQRAWRVLAGDGASRPLHQRLIAGVGFPALVHAVNAAGLGPVNADISGPQLRRASLRAMGEVVRRLVPEAEHVVFGHTHRAGPLPGDDPGEWVAPTGTRLHNAGTWVHERFLVGDTGHESPYWPGGAVRLGDDGSLEVLRLLAGRAPLSLPRPA